MPKTASKMALRRRLKELTEEEFLKGGKIIINIKGEDYEFDYKVKKVDKK